MCVKEDKQEGDKAGRWCSGGEAVARPRLPRASRPKLNLETSVTVNTEWTVPPHLAHPDVCVFVYVQVCVCVLFEKRTFSVIPIFFFFSSYKGDVRHSGN